MVGPRVLALALHGPLEHLSLVNIPVLKVVLPHPVLLPVACLPLVHSVLVLKRLLQELKRVADLLLPKDFLGKVLQLP